MTTSEKEIGGGTKMDTSDQCHSVEVEVRIRRTFLIKLACQINEWFYPLTVSPGSLPDKLLRLGCRVARAEHRVDGGPWHKMGDLRPRWRTGITHTEVEVEVYSRDNE